MFWLKICACTHIKKDNIAICGFVARPDIHTRANNYTKTIILYASASIPSSFTQRHAKLCNNHLNRKPKWALGGRGAEMKGEPGCIDDGCCQGAGIKEKVEV